MIHNGTQLLRSGACSSRNLNLQCATKILEMLKDEEAMTKDSQEIHLTPIEYKLLTLLARNAGTNALVRDAYDLLGLQTYFTVGVKEVRAWTVRKGAKAPEAAAVIHTDFEKGFIRAETIAYDDYVTLKGEAGARDGSRMVRDAALTRFASSVATSSGTSTMTRTPKPSSTWKSLPH